MPLSSNNHDLPHRILIVRLTALGDVIHGLPVLCALRESYPRAFIGWAVEGSAGDLLEGHKALDELIRLPRHWLKSPREVIRLRRRLRRLNFDTTLDLQCLTKSGFAARLSGAQKRIGKAGRDGRELSKWFNNVLVEPGGEHVIDHYLGMLRPFGIESPEVKFDLPDQAQAIQFITNFQRSKKLANQQFALISPGAGWPSKLWPAQRYGQVARHLVCKHQLLSVVVWAGDQERELAKTIATESAGSAIVAPGTSITELAALTRNGRLFVGSDTGPMHLAVAVGTPAISLHGPSRAEWCGAYGPHNTRLQVRLDEGRSRHRQNTDDSAMREISVEMVSEACDQLLTANTVRRCG